MSKRARNIVAIAVLLIAAVLLSTFTFTGTPTATEPTAPVATSAPADSTSATPSPSPVPLVDWADADSFVAAFEGVGFTFTPQGPDVQFGVSDDEIAAVEIAGSSAVESLTVYDGTAGAEGLDILGFALGLVWSDVELLNAGASYAAEAIEAVAEPNTVAEPRQVGEFTIQVGSTEAGTFWLRITPTP